VDYLKYDNCNPPSNPLEPEPRYTAMSAALNETGRPIVFSMCDWGVRAPWRWGPAIANSWRTTDDIQDDWNDLLRCLDNTAGLSEFAGPGGWNDPGLCV
jgi:alpha-galactosidase